MIGLEADDTGQPFLAHQHRLAQQDPPVDAAHGVELQIALLRDGVDHQAHLIHVGGQHQLFVAGDPSLFLYDQVAHGIHADLIGMGFRCRTKIVPHGVFPAGNTGQGAKFF